MKVYTPFRPVLRPDVLSVDATYDGHAVMVASGHPAAISGEFAWTAIAGAGVALLAVEVYVHRFVREPRSRPLGGGGRGPRREGDSPTPLQAGPKLSGAIL